MDLQNSDRQNVCEERRTEKSPSVWTQTATVFETATWWKFVLKLVVVATVGVVIVAVVVVVVAVVVVVVVVVIATVGVVVEIAVAPYTIAVEMFGVVAKQHLTWRGDVL